MTIPENLKFSKDHEWIRVEGDEALVGITEFAAGELGDVVYVDVDSIGESLKQDEVFGTVEAVKTVSDLFLPVSAEILEFNEAIEEEPSLVNSDPYGEGWIVKIKIENEKELDTLMDAEAYSEMLT